MTADIIADLRRAEAAVSRVRALADEWAAACPTTHADRHRLCKAGQLRAALEPTTEGGS